MPDPSGRLRRQIRLGEDSSIEFKAVVFAGGRITGPARDDLADELAAFANALGGTVCIGIDDRPREVVGVPADRLAAVEHYVSEIVRDSITPPLYPDIHWIEVPDRAGQQRPILAIEIRRSLFVHQSPSGYLRRVGSAHRDYSVRESTIRLRLFADRLELCSPGGLSNTMTVDALAYRQASRNEIVTSLLARCAVPSGIDRLETPRKTLMDRRGEGVRAIIERSERLSGKAPTWDLFDGAELRLTIYAAGPVDD